MGSDVATMMVFRDQECCSVTMEAGVEEEEGGCWSETCLAGTGGLVLDAKPKHTLPALIFSTNNYINKSMLSIKICLSLSRFLFLITKEGTFFCIISNPSSSFHFKAFNVCDSSSPRRVLLSDSWVPWPSSEQTCVLAEGLSISLHSRHYLTLSLQSEHRR